MKQIKLLNGTDNGSEPEDGRLRLPDSFLDGHDDTIVFDIQAKIKSETEEDLIKTIV